MAKWPSEKRLSKIRKNLENTPGSKVITDDFPLVDRIKRDICAEFIIYKRENKLNQRELAQKLEISEALISKILRYHFDEFTIDRLIRYLEVLGIKYEFRRVG